METVVSEQPLGVALAGDPPAAAEPTPPSAPDRSRSALAWWVAGWMVAVAARALWVALVHEPSRSVFSDMAGYFNRSGEVIASSRWDPNLFLQGAGYPLVLGALRKIWARPDPGLFIAFVQIAGSLAALAGTVMLAGRVAGRRWAAAALALGAIHVPWLFFNSVYMPEALYTAALAGVGLALLALARDPDARWRRTLLLGAAGGLAAWLKSTHLLVGFVAAALWVFPLRRGWRGSVRILAGWLAGLALTFWIPHGVLSQRTAGRFMASPPTGGLNFVEGKCPSKENHDSAGYGYWSPLFVQQGKRNTKWWPRPFYDQGYFWREGLKCVAERPVVLVESLDFVRTLFVGNELWPANVSGPRGVWLSTAWARTFEWPLAAGVALALALALARSRRAEARDERSAAMWLALAAPALGLFALVWITKSELRYRIPYDVFFLPLALWGWKELAVSISRRVFRAAPPVPAAVSVAAGPAPVPAVAPAVASRSEAPA